MRPEGASFYLSQVLAGTIAPPGTFLPDGTWRPNLDLFATEPVLVDEAPQTMEYRLRTEAVWSDGEPISGDDFLYNWFHNSGRPEHCDGCDPVDTTGWDRVAHIEIDGEVVRIVYEDGVRDPEWFARFGPSAYPAHVAEAAGFDWRTPAGMGASSAFFRDTIPAWSGGPYLIRADSVVADQRVVLVPNPRWYGEVAPALERIVLEVIPNQPDWPLAVANGELDGGAPLGFDPDVAAQLAALDGVSTAVGSAGATWEHVQVNVASPAVADVELRRALLTALDTVDARARLFGDLLPPLRTNPFFSLRSPHHQDRLAGTGFGSGDLEAARERLGAAGYEGAEPGRSLTLDGEPVPPLRFLHLAGHPTRSTYVQLAADTLAAIGVTIEPVGLPGPEFGPALLGGEFDLVILALDGGPLFTRAPSLYFDSASGANYANLDDPAVDAAGAAVFGQLDLDAAADQANEVAALVLGQASILPLWDNLTMAFARDGVVNVRDDLHSGLRAMYDMASWGIAAE